MGFLLLELPSICFVCFTFSPPSTNIETVQARYPAPLYISLFCCCCFFMTTWRLTHCWHNATERATAADLRQERKKTSPTSTLPPYLSKTPLWVGIAAFTWMSAWRRRRLIADSCRRFGGANTVVSVPRCFGRRGCHTPRVAIVCFSVVRLINHEYFMIACSLLDKVPSSWWRMLMMWRIISLNAVQLN